MSSSDSYRASSSNSCGLGRLLLEHDMSALIESSAAAAEAKPVAASGDGGLVDAATVTAVEALNLSFSDPSSPTDALSMMNQIQHSQAHQHFPHQHNHHMTPTSPITNSTTTTTTTTSPTTTLPHFLQHQMRSQSPSRSFYSSPRAIFSATVGSKSSSARWFLPGVGDVLKLLQMIAVQSIGGAKHVRLQTPIDGAELWRIVNGKILLIVHVI